MTHLHSTIGSRVPAFPFPRREWKHVNSRLLRKVAQDSSLLGLNKHPAKKRLVGATRVNTGGG